MKCALSSTANQGVIAVSRKGRCFNTYELEAKLGALCKEHHFYLKAQLTMFIQTWIFGRFFQNEQRELQYFKKNDWRYLLSITKFKLSNEN